jgi:hypothetical protein
MKYQLVLQFPHESLVDYDSMVALEDELLKALGPEHDVDGHDWGSGEMNIFIHSDEPRAAFDAARRLIPADLHRSLKAAYRNLEGETYTVVWPPGATTFEVK